MALRLPSLCVTVVAVAIGRADSPQEHWAWKPPTRPAVPAVRGSPPANPIDAFIRAKLDAGRPHARAARVARTPPSPRHVRPDRPAADAGGGRRVRRRHVARTPGRRWSTGCSPSPHYGERWGRHWLDLARYADTNGYEFDEARPDAWRYRDYVIRSFNADKPYDRFVREQLAGDEAFPGDPDALIATGFNLLGPDMTDASRPGAAAAEHAQRHDRHGRPGVPRADGRLRPLPRPQVRADPADRLLPPAGVLHAGRVPPRPAGRHARAADGARAAARASTGR